MLASEKRKSERYSGIRAGAVPKLEPLEGQAGGGAGVGEGGVANEGGVKAGILWAGPVKEGVAGSGAFVGPDDPGSVASGLNELSNTGRVRPTTASE